MKTRRAFTLMEMLVVIVILLILMGMTLVLVGTFNIRDTTADAANQVVATCSQARQRAAKFGERRGVRLILRPGEHYVTSMVPIGGPSKFDQSTQPPTVTDAAGTVTPNPDAAQIRVTTATGATESVLSNIPALWGNMETAGILDTAGAQIMINGRFYHMRKVGGNWRTTRAVSEPYRNALTDYTLQGLKMVVTTNAEAVELPRGSVIDLDHSIIPTEWTLPSGDHSDKMDIVFSPLGKQIGPLLPAGGTIMLLVTNINDIDKLPGDPNKRNPESIVAIFRRGLITTSSVDDTDADGNGVADDPFNFAHLGREKK